MDRAVIFVPTGISAARWWDVCTEYCSRNGYEIALVASDWRAASLLWCEGSVDVIVVARLDHVHHLQIVSEETDEATRRPLRRPRPGTWVPPQ